MAAEQKYCVGVMAGEISGASITIRVSLNTGDVARLQSRILGTKGRINAGLTARAHAMGALGVQMLNDAAPTLEGDNWVHGDPQLNSAHAYRYSNPYYTELYTTAEHEPFIVYGFTPHMPPPEAWTGDEEGSYPARKAVLDAGTPTNPVDFWSPVEAALEGVNGDWAARIGDMIWTGG
jgi:hypothetical protein